MGELEKIKTVPEAMSDNDSAGYFGPNDIPDNLKSPRARMARDVSEVQTMDVGAKVDLVLGISAPGTRYK